MIHLYAYTYLGDGIEHITSFKSRYQGLKYLITLAKAGRMIHWYFLSSLDYDKAVKRYGK